MNFQRHQKKKQEPQNIDATTYESTDPEPVIEEQPMHPQVSDRRHLKAGKAATKKMQANHVHQKNVVIGNVQQAVARSKNIQRKQHHGTRAASNAGALKPIKGAEQRGSSPSTHRDHHQPNGAISSSSQLVKHGNQAQPPQRLVRRSPDREQQALR